MSDPVDTQRLRELLEASTPGPWHGPVWDGDEKEYLVLEEDEHGSILATVHDCGTPGRSAHRNAALIVSAVNSLPALLEEVERWRFDSGLAAPVGFGLEALLDAKKLLLDYADAKVERLTQERDVLRAEVERLRSALPRCCVCFEPIDPDHARIGAVDGSRVAHAGCEAGL